MRDAGRVWTAAAAVVMGCALFTAAPVRTLADGFGIDAIDPRVCSPGEKRAKEAFRQLKVPAPPGVAPDDPAANDIGDNHYVEMFDGKFTCGYGTQSFRNVINAFKAAYVHRGSEGKRIPLVLHFHGGLVSGENGFSAPVNNGNVMWNAYTTNAFPVFFVWHSGAGEIGAREILPQTGHITTAHGLVNRWDFINESAAERERNGTGHADFPIGGHITAAENVNLREQQLRHENLINGANMWRHMENEIDWSLQPGDDRGGYLMVQSIAELAADPEFRVLLVGHSMGAIFASRLIETYAAYVDQHPELSASARHFKFDVIFLAPAAKYRVFDRALRTGRIQNFRMFTMYDRCERLDHVTRRALNRGPLNQFKEFYPRSLLYFVSSVTDVYPDVPLIGLHRFMEDPQFDDDVLVRSVNQRMLGYANSIVLSPTSENGGQGNDGLEVNAISHGDFDEDPTFLVTLPKIIVRGFTPQPAPQPHPTKSPRYATCGKNEPKALR